MTEKEKRILVVDGAGGAAVLTGTKARLFIADAIYDDPMSVPDEAWYEIGPFVIDEPDRSEIVLDFIAPSGVYKRPRVGIAPDTDHSTGNRRARRAAEAKGGKRK